jgi:N4-gp56 family major capsid protein
MSTTSAFTGGGYSPLAPEVRDLYSKEILFQAQPLLKFAQFAKIKRDLTALSGKSIVFIKYNNLDLGRTYEESDVLTTQALSASEVSISVKEQISAVTVTEMLVKVALTDVMQNASRLLGANLAQTVDVQLRDTALSTTNILFGGGKAAAANLVAGDGLDSTTVLNVVEQLASNNAPKLEGEYYVCIAHPHQLRQLREDNRWIETNKYNGRGQLYKGEVGMYEGCIFIETSHMPQLTSGQVDAKYGTTGAPAGHEAVFFGDNAYAWGIALEPELRDDGVIELGRKHTLGWYGIWGSGLLEEDNIFRVLTAKN